jgi:hypothetical protein
MSLRDDNSSDCKDWNWSSSEELESGSWADPMVLCGCVEAPSLECVGVMTLTDTMHSPMRMNGPVIASAASMGMRCDLLGGGPCIIYCCGCGREIRGGEGDHKSMVERGLLRVEGSLRFEL